MRSTQSEVVPLAVLAIAGLTLAGCSPTEEKADPVLTTVAEASPEAQQNDSASSETTPENDTPAEDTPESDAPSDNTGDTPAGTTCGEVRSLGDGSPLAIVTLDADMNCDEVMEVFDDYMSDSPSGMPPQGSGAFWTAPNGWTCGGNNFLFPGDEDQKFNKYPSCGPNHSSEAVVAVPPERVSELPV